MLPKFALLPLICLAFFPWATLHAQDHLYLENPGRFKRVEIEPGDSIRFSLKGEKFDYGARIRGARADWVYLAEDSIKVTEIDALWLRPKPGERYWIGMVQAAALTAAIIYPVMVLLNRTAVTGFESKNLLETLFVSGGSVAFFCFMNIFHWKKRNLEKGKWRLTIRPRI